MTGGVIEEVFLAIVLLISPIQEELKMTGRNDSLRNKWRGHRGNERCHLHSLVSKKNLVLHRSNSLGSLNVEIIQQGNLIDKWSGSNHNNSPDNKWNKDKLHSSELKAGQIEKYCILEKAAEELLEDAFRRLRLSARSYHGIIRTARTIADLDGAVKIGVPHISEAICFRSADKSIWRI